MTSREKILSAVKNAQPTAAELPDISFKNSVLDPLEQFIVVLQSIGGAAQMIRLRAMADVVRATFPEARRTVSPETDFSNFAEIIAPDIDPHSLESVDVAVIKAHFAVAENGAVWVTEEQMGARVLPFICQHLVLVVKTENIVANMHEAYERIGSRGYGFGVFIAGPSKTADIEQSLVIGAHGARSLTVFLV